MSSKARSLSLNSSWPHYASILVVFAAVVFGALRYFIIDHSDPLHCEALLNEGSWLDRGHKNWQPEGCMLHTYAPKDATQCLSSRSVVFIGDSITRKLFFQFANILDQKLPSAPPSDDQKHTDYALRSSGGVQIDFHWDPFLNSTHVEQLASTSGVEGLSRTPAMLVLGSGLWFLRYANSSGGLPAWEATIEGLVENISRFHSRIADKIVLLPVEEVVPLLLSRERASTMHISDIEAMNSDLYHRIHPPTDPSSLFGLESPASLPISLPLVFNKMLDSSETEDGLHFNDSVVRMQANVLLNLRCNDVLPKIFPLNKTCCRSYPTPSALQSILLGITILWGPSMWLFSRKIANRQLFSSPLIREDEIPAIVISTSILLIYLADRTGFWLKEQKQFDPWTFGFLSLVAVAAGLATVKREDKDLGFLNREQTDEWKGWMQLAILIYHYLGASKISGIYNVIRVVVAAYLFMTGYGHTIFYTKKADFGLLRVAQVIFRLNFLTVLLAYVMNTDYLFYYFAPLVSFWYLIIYGTMIIGAQFNDRTAFLVFKIFLSMGVVTWFMRGESWLLEMVFSFLERVFAIHWDAREWRFRVTLDLYIVYFGMLVALAVMKIRERRLTDHPQWALAVKIAVAVSFFVTIWFLAFELTQESKFTYNAWHPYISFLPISAFIVLRNASTILRSSSSRLFAFVGRCSLETFIIQYHLWLAADTQGVLLVLPGTKLRPINFIITSIMFVYVSDCFARATGHVTNWICGTGDAKGLPTVNVGPAAATRRSGEQHGSSIAGQESIPLTSTADHEARKGDDGQSIPPESNAPIRPSRRWADRLAEESQTMTPGFRLWYGDAEWRPGLKTKIAFAAAIMWIANLMWTYPAL